MKNRRPFSCFFSSGSGSIDGDLRPPTVLLHATTSSCSMGNAAAAVAAADICSTHHLFSFEAFPPGKGGMSPFKRAILFLLFFLPFFPSSSSC